MPNRGVQFYQQRQEYWVRQAADANAKDDRVATLRLTTSALLIAGLVWAFGFNGSYWVLAPLALYFGYLVVRHAAISRLKRRAALALHYFEHALSRFSAAWVGMGPGEAYAPEDHPYSTDLDLFGEGSLFDLVCTAQTTGGKAMLAQWLLAPATVEVVVQRQQASHWLTPRAQLREEMALLATQYKSTISPQALELWGNANQPLLQRGATVSLAAWGLTCGFIVSVGVWVFTDLGPTVLLVHAVIAWLVQRYFAEATRSALAGLDSAEKELALLATLLQRVELELAKPDAPPLIRALGVKLGVDRTTAAPDPQHSAQASLAIADLKRRLSWLEARSNQLVAPLAYLAGWSLHCGRSIDKWRQKFGPHLGDWLDSLAQFEALCALSHFQFDRPHYSLPILETTESALFAACGLGHPLLPIDDCVTNDIALGHGVQVLLVSGSNMSGKSTLLRTIGVNVVLALAGGVVFASELRLSRLQLGATLRIQDSLLKGRSRFYAEIVRLKLVVDLSRERLPLLFLLDEMLAGTNSNDRLIGAQQIIKGLVDHEAIGLVTTHDLALALAADELAPKARNVHFRDALIEGKLEFDYQVHEGVVQHSNALELMRSIGLTDQ